MLIDYIIYFGLFLNLYLLFLFFIAFFEEEEKSLYLKKLPKVAIIVPAFNEEDTIEATVDSLLNLDYPKNKLKIYVVDDGSTDNTLKVLQKYSSKRNVEILHKENGGKASAMNYAYKRLDKDTELVGILDADSMVRSNALLKIVEKFSEDKDIAAVTPAIKIWQPQNVVRFLQNAEYNLSIWLRKAMSSLGVIFIIPGPFSFYRKEALDIAGPWKHAHGTEDLEMGLRFQKLGFKIKNQPEAVVYTKAPYNFVNLYKQRLRWTYGFLNNALDYKDMLFKEKRAINLLILPSALFSIFFAIFMFFYAFYTILDTLVSKIVYWKYAGMDLSFSLSLPDVFYLHFSLILFASLLIIPSIIYAMFLGDRVSKEQSLKVRDIISYILLYAQLVPLWLISATYRTVKKREVIWEKVNKE